jgi:hypothetical protein
MELFDVLDAEERRKAGESLTQLTNARVAQADATGYADYAKALQRQATRAEAEKPKFDEAAFAAAKLRAKRGE